MKNLADSIRKPLTIGGLVLIQYTLLTLNFRMIAEGNYVGTALSEVAVCSVGFFLIKSIAAAQTKLEFVGYVTGGVLGSALGIFLSNLL